MMLTYPGLRSAKNVKRKIKRHVTNRWGWETPDKLMVIESDDWGSIRTPSKDVLLKLTEGGDPAMEDPFYRYDGLESVEDVRGLKDLLEAFKDHKGRAPVFTMNFAMANPDFARIRGGGFQTYFFEPFTATYQHTPGREASFEWLQAGMKSGVFFPQLHCREHVNVHRWMKDLAAGKPDVLLAFSNRMISVGASATPTNQYAYMDSFNYDSANEWEDLRTIIQGGAQLFEETFGYRSKSLIASCYIWDEVVEEVLAQEGIEFLQGARVQLKPGRREGTKRLEKALRRIGDQNGFGQRYLLRNCVFEPSWRNDVDWVEQCLEEMACAFKWKKPATISTHRLNYMGGLDEKNREKNLALLYQLISRAIKKWPDLEFIHSVELGTRMKG